MTGTQVTLITWPEHKTLGSQWLEHRLLASRDYNTRHLNHNNRNTCYLDHVTTTQIAPSPVNLYEPSRWRRALLGKLIVPTFVGKYTTFLRAEVHCHIDKSQLHDHIPSHMYPVHAPILFLEEIFNIIFSLTLSKVAKHSLKDTVSHNRRSKSSKCVILHLMIQSVPRCKHFSSRL